MSKSNKPTDPQIPPASLMPEQKRDFSQLKRSKFTDEGDKQVEIDLHDDIFKLELPTPQTSRLSTPTLKLEQDFLVEDLFVEQSVAPEWVVSNGGDKSANTDELPVLIPQATIPPIGHQESHIVQENGTNPAYVQIKPKGQMMIEDGQMDMPISLTKKTLSGKQIGMVMGMSLLLITWLKQDRLADYWQQSYQTGQPWTALASLGVWQSGEQVGHALGIGKVNHVLAYMGVGSQAWLNKTFFAKPSPDTIQSPSKFGGQELSSQSLSNQGQAINLPADETLGASPNPPNSSNTLPAQITPKAISNSTPKLSTPLTHITLQAGQKVLFAGDSMMQGVAPWVMRKLKHEYQIDSLDLSKQSTGLSYSSFFDWPATIEKALAEHDNIKALIIYLGANDPWAVPNPASKSAKYIEFATDEWVVLYHQKIHRILDNSKSHGVQVIWITPPTMKKTKLNEQMKILTDIMHKGIDDTQVVVMDSKPLLSPSDAYTDSIIIDGKMVKVRTADGIHFTTDGQKYLAKHILERIQAEP